MFVEEINEYRQDKEIFKYWALEMICIPIKQFILENKKYLSFEQLLYL